MPVSASPLLNALLSQGLDAARAIAAELRQQVLGLTRPGIGPAERLRGARRAIFDHEPLFARTLTDMLLSAWLAGATEVTERLPDADSGIPESRNPVEILPGLNLPTLTIPPPEPPPPRFADSSGATPDEPEPVVHFPLIEIAAQDLADRRVMTREDFDQLEADAKRAAFTVAHVGSLDTLERLRGALSEDVAQGGTLAEFREKVEVSLGESVLSDAHIENVYRTNVAVAHAKGLEEVATHAMVIDEFPFRLTEPVRDSRLSELCAIISRSGLDGTGVYYYADPVWQKYRNPRHWQCRCGTILLNLEDAAKRGVLAAREWLETGTPPLGKLFVPHPSIDLPNGWAPGGGEMGII